LFAFLTITDELISPERMPISLYSNVVLIVVSEISVGLSLNEFEVLISFKVIELIVLISGVLDIESASMPSK
jgi:hypothetical protein